MTLVSNILAVRFLAASSRGVSRERAIDVCSFDRSAKLTNLNLEEMATACYDTIYRNCTERVCVHVVRLAHVAVHDRTSDATTEAREKSVNEIPFTAIIRLILAMFSGRVRVRTFVAESGFALGRDHESNDSRRRLRICEKNVFEKH